MATANRMSDRVRAVLGKSLKRRGSLTSDEWVRILRSVIGQVSFRSMRRMNTIPEHFKEETRYFDVQDCDFSFRGATEIEVITALQEGISHSTPFLHLGYLQSFKQFNPNGKESVVELRLTISRKGEIFCERTQWRPDESQPAAKRERQRYIPRSITLISMRDDTLLDMLFDTGKGPEGKDYLDFGVSATVMPSYGNISLKYDYENGRLDLSYGLGIGTGFSIDAAALYSFDDLPNSNSYITEKAEGSFGYGGIIQGSLETWQDARKPKLSKPTINSAAGVGTGLGASANAGANYNLTLINNSGSGSVQKLISEIKNRINAIIKEIEKEKKKNTNKQNTKKKNGRN